jgi:hypothetical protein
MSRAARVVMAIERRVSCRSPIGRCFDYVRTGRSWSARAHTGANAVTVPRRRLAPGRYRLTAAPAGGVKRSVAFRLGR